MAGAGVVEDISRPEADSRAGGEAEAPGGRLRRHRHEGLELAGIHCSILVGRGEMAVQRIDIEALQQPFSDLGGRKAEAIHAGVYHDVTGPALPALPPALHLQRSVEDRKSTRLNSSH